MVRAQFSNLLGMFIFISWTISYLLFMTTPMAMASAFFNEIHYDNSGSDIGEAFEIAGTAGTKLENWSLALYNGDGGTVYGTKSLSGTIPDQQNGFGVQLFSCPGLQNGPDGVALIDDNGLVIQFLSYEGSFSAVEGPAAGMTSINIGVFEDGSTPAGYSLQLTGTGTIYSDFSWIGPVQASFGIINTSQNFGSDAVPLPPSVILLSSGLLGLIQLRRRERETP